MMLKLVFETKIHRDYMNIIFFNFYLSPIMGMTKLHIVVA